MNQHESQKPTTRSAELLLRIFNAYPVLESLLSCSHRQDIVNLARTCHTLHLTFTTTVGRLPNAFPSCIWGRKPCFLCNIPLCQDCHRVSRRLETPRETMKRQRFKYALLGRNEPRISPELIGSERWVMAGQTISHRIKDFYLCGPCYSSEPEELIGKYLQPDWRISVSLPGYLERLSYMSTITWWEVPSIDTACACDMFDLECEASPYLVRCEASPHLVRVENLPIESEWAAVVHIDHELSREFRSALILPRNSAHADRGDRYIGTFIPFYMMDA
ncbi:hypothetical protein BGX38DRAFT_1223987 [Terfezia claveryi]|nr:hypothetical protein BGX38DRAFT_1223987 [Terfezia claveryi]